MICVLRTARACVRAWPRTCFSLVEAQRKTRNVKPPIFILAALLAAPAQADIALPTPLDVQDVVELARARRGEIVAATARARAASQRPAMVSALDDPTVSFSADHIPYSGMGLDWSITFQQSIPLSRVRGNRERAAAANARRERLDIERVALDVELEAARAFWMLAEARAAAAIATQQHALAEQLVQAATARYTANTGTQSDVLRAEIEVARLGAEVRALGAEVRAAEAMLNTSVARDLGAPVPALDVAVSDAAPPAQEAIASATSQIGRAHV